MSFELVGLPALSRFAVDRSEPLRGDDEKLAALWPKARMIVVDTRGRTLVADRGTRLADRPALEFGDLPPVNAVLLGEQDGVAWFAVLMPAEDGEAVPASRAWGPPELTDEPQWLDLRQAGATLDDMSAGLFTTAAALFQWHRLGKYCAKCGARTVLEKSGWASVCSGCGREEYPRTDSAVICLVHDGADQVLVARGPEWPEGRFSVLAGFVEAGESLEACVAREIAEEVGVSVHDIRYLGSQPWPFPRSLMIGFEAVADPAEPLRLAEGEIAEAKWVSRADVRKAIEEPGSIPGLGLAGGASIAFRMLQSWSGATSEE
ncbi:NAD(+) diphosphatase [Lentzea flaviverrucosa]|uniref:NAD(+) diphosphatase n=1 Tax=Lentzea flaviverrucosa TaxID=200379 RepID=A0A1H9MZN2_9PSEU|nr:NAD(+) diphosphatase [Lentzea flaviverrucosa]RDI30729.1 NAD+ diphosphatase [Lentzea flaviverrucosa]SER28865.1 NAD+ diphosphatase [Lentzea flaviverrucosa]